MTSSNGKISALLAICAGNSPVPGEFPAQRPVTRNNDNDNENKFIAKVEQQLHYTYIYHP